MEGIMLIVDDVEVNREILKVLFHSHYEIMEAENAEEALEVLEGCQGSIDIVLLDLMMPGMSGIDLLKKRQELEYFKTIPVVMITSSAQAEDQVEAFALGANDFIIKPFVPEIVISRVNNVMASSRRLLSMELEAQKLRVKSELDEMTGLYNKTTSELVMNERLKSSGGQLDVMLVIDIDNFKTVNDTSGHQSGDHVIKIVANLISGRFRKTDFVGRIGGDEFCVLMTSAPDMKIVYSKVNEMIQIMRYKPNLAIPEYVTLSIGVASNQRRPTTYADLFKCADQALYQAKELGKAQFCEYGVEPINLQEDHRPAVVLLSDNRSVCSAVHALLPAEIRVIEALCLEDMSHLPKEEQEKVTFVYADVSDAAESTEAYWEGLKRLEWIQMDKVFAICREGCVSQYMAALQSGVLDMFTAPIDNETFRRRTMRQFEKIGISELS